MENNWLLVVAVVYFAAILHGIVRKQAEIDDKLLRLSRHLGLVADVGAEPSERVQRLAAERGKYIEALRAYRSETGADLKQARQAVDRLRPRTRNG